MAKNKSDQSDEVAQGEAQPEEKPEWDEATHGPVPEESKDQYTVVQPEEPEQGQAEQAQAEQEQPPQ
jgi:hypothetical protein